MPHIKGQLIDAQFEIQSSEPTARIGRVYYDSVLDSYRGRTSAGWVTFAVGTVGAGSVVNWHAGSGGSAADGAPTENEENGQKVYRFERGRTQSLTLFFRIPQNYQPGQQISLNIGVYSPGASGTVQMQAVCTLIRQDNDAVTSTSLQETKSATELTNTTANQFRTTSIPITDSDGEIASTAVSSGDLVKIQLQRGSDTDTEDTRFIPTYTEFTYA